VKQIIFTDPAIGDIERAKKWYEKQQQNLGNKFVDYVFKCVDEIKNHPLAYPNKYKYVREMYIRKYPYLIIYSVEEKIIFILRVFPCKTSPKKKYK
jgi:plasmid stabilization system protein ParE